MKEELAIFWFRRDLRLVDNAALYHALKSGFKVLPIFIFDTNILSKIQNKKDRRVDFIFSQTEKLKIELKNYYSDLEVFEGKPNEIIEGLIEKYNIKSIYSNHDYEKYGINRDNSIHTICQNSNIEFHSFKDQCIFEEQEILSNSGTPYTVFTPYSKKWKEKLNSYYYKSYPVLKYSKGLLKFVSTNQISLDSIGFEPTDIDKKIPKLDLKTIKHYKENRDFPAIKGTTQISMHLRFGTISIRNCVKIALNTNETWLNELIWRDFYMNILANFPHVGQGKAFRKEYDNIEWRQDETGFAAWCEGKTGFPIVDAGMRELNATGFMHNRVRMITASFLCKDLLIDWRWGEAYFAEKLNDFDFSANNGGWQWASGSGCDAAPYFRVFNPTSQTEKFDKELKYIKKWIPELNGFDYPQPIVDHKLARERALKVYKEGLTNNN